MKMGNNRRSVVVYPFGHLRSSRRFALGSGSEMTPVQYQQGMRKRLPSTTARIEPTACKLPLSKATRTACRASVVSAHAPIIIKLHAG